MENMNFEVMKVAELKDESRKRGLKLEHKGHKFTKAELIERLVRYEKEQRDIDSDIQKAIDEAGEEQKAETKCEDVKTCAGYSNSSCENTQEVKENKIMFATTIEEIEKKYGVRKPQFVYDKDLKVGSTVLFVEVVEAASGWIGKKLRKGIVKGINRKKELVKAETFFGKEFVLGFEELLFIKDSERASWFPKDIKCFLWNQRNRNGRKINERTNKYY